MAEWDCAAAMCFRMQHWLATFQKQLGHAECTELLTKIQNWNKCYFIVLNASWFLTQQESSTKVPGSNQYKCYWLCTGQMTLLGSPFPCSSIPLVYLVARVSFCHIPEAKRKEASGLLSLASLTVPCCMQQMLESSTSIKPSTPGSQQPTLTEHWAPTKH